MEDKTTQDKEYSQPASGEGNVLPTITHATAVNHRPCSSAFAGRGSFSKDDIPAAIKVIDPCVATAAFGVGNCFGYSRRIAIK